ncbi:MAG: uroporphyrinogen decarboxylase family protein [Acidobacteriota bacterium]|nr:uroporphyrinogen decarboxylase family protein [Acidobacteriota bacterium]
MKPISSRSRDARRSLRELADTLYHEEGRRAIMPLMGYPGLNLTRSSVKQNQFNHSVQYQTISRLYEATRPDALLFLMDLSVEASALGLPVRFPLDNTPTVEGHEVQRLDDLRKFRHVDILADGRVMVYLEVMKHLRAGLPVPVGAYITGPYTLAGLMSDATRLAMNVVMDPETAHAVLEFAAQTVTRYARALLDSGADFLMMLDPTAVMLGPEQYREFAGSYAREVIGLMDDAEVILHICGDTGHIVEDMAATGAAGLSLDSPMDFAQLARVLGPDTLLIGNVDPVAILRGSEQTVAAATEKLLDSMQDVPGFILSTGCDLPQDTPMANIQAFMATGRAWQRSAEMAETAVADGAAC